jgi:hypothetical protein
MGTGIGHAAALHPPGPSAMVRRAGPVAQLDRALPSEGRGREFESRRVRQFFKDLGPGASVGGRPMKLLGLSMRAAVAAFVLSSAACSRDLIFEGNEYSNPIRNNKIKELYKARDACLAKNAVPAESSNMDVTSVAKAVSLSCAPETDKLIAASNLDKDPKVADAIRSDTERKAALYVMRAQR